MCEAVNFFRQALAEQGLDANVTHEPNDDSDKFYVSKEINGKNITYSTNVPHDIDGSTSDKKIAMTARNIAQKYKDKMMETFEFQAREICVQSYNEPLAICKNCQTEVTMPLHTKRFAEGAELSNPKPKPIDKSKILHSLDNHSKVMLRMYLIGKLREECDEECLNHTT